MASATPVDQLDHEALQTLKTAIKKLDAAKVSDESADYAVWGSLIESALARSPQFQKLVIDQELTPDAHGLRFLSTTNDWLLGIVLPGYYKEFQDFEDGLSVITDLLPGAVKRAQSALVTILRKTTYSALQATS